MKYNFEKLEKGFKKKWVAALRSGKYVQGQEGYLKEKVDTKEYKWCCIGVGADVCGATNLGTNGYLVKGKKIRGFKKIPLQLVDVNTLTQKLAGMNDSGNWSFKRIAAWIEKYL